MVSSIAYYYFYYKNRKRELVAQKLFESTHKEESEYVIKITLEITL